MSDHNVTLDGTDYPITLPSPSICRDLVIYYDDNGRRAQLAALGLCVALPALPPAMPPTLAHQPLGRAGYRGCRGNLFDYAERVEARLEALGVPFVDQNLASMTCWTLCADSVLPGLTEAVSRVDFGNAGAESILNASASV
jgi:hypothetical protein